MKKISFILPSRNNLKYLKQAYHSIRNNCTIQHEICIASDNSNDGTVDWVENVMQLDEQVKFHINPGPERLGHTILYDTLINEYATNDIVMIFHADMYICPGAEDEIDKYLEPGKVVSLTRIEPPLHPPGPEKILADYGIEPEEFDEKQFLQDLSKFKQNKTTEGIFAPWAIYKSDFQKIGGHDPLYAPQSKEDSDIFNRFVLAGYELIQTWEGFVYHMTCRGSRFKDGAKRNPDGEVFMKNRETDEWLQQNQRSTRNFIRKWGHFVKHDQYLKPHIPPKYNIAFEVYNCGPELLRELEPWCSVMYVDGYLIDDYIKKEQPDTMFDLKDKVRDIKNQFKFLENDITVSFEASEIGVDKFNFIVRLPEIIKESGELGIMEYDIFKLNIKALKTYEEELIKCER
jgi:glycosyltransferase involved in cell wall biosynthesis